MQIGAKQQRLHQFVALPAMDETLEQRQMIQHVLDGDSRVHAEVLRKYPKPLADLVLLAQNVNLM